MFTASGANEGTKNSTQTTAIGYSPMSPSYSPTFAPPASPSSDSSERDFTYVSSSLSSIYNQEN